MAEEGDASDALADLELLLKDDPENEELLQMKAELLGVQEQLDSNMQQTLNKPSTDQTTAEEGSVPTVSDASYIAASQIGPQIPDHILAMLKQDEGTAAPQSPSSALKGDTSTAYGSTGGAHHLDKEDVVPLHRQEELKAKPQSLGVASLLSTVKDSGRTVDARGEKQESQTTRFYTEEPSFAELAKKDEKFAAYVRHDDNGRGTIDFRDPTASRELTRALLKHDFGVNWSLAEGQLIPAVTNRINYIHWLEDLLALSSPEGTVSGLDIGCGANLIYCLLGASVHGWQMTGLDITEEAEQGANNNLEANPHLAKLIDLVIKLKSPGSPNQGITCDLLNQKRMFTFCMCNPPFFEALEDAEQNPATAFQGTAAEMVCQGGELAFVRQLVQESLQFKESIHWFTSMLGKKSTLKAVRQDLQRLPITALRVTEFVQGRTSRWGIAWSFVALKREASQKRLQVSNPVPLITKKSTVILLESSTAKPLEVLHSIRIYFEEQGMQCAVDTTMFTIRVAGCQPIDEDEIEDSVTPREAKKPRSVTPSKDQGKFSLTISVAVERKGVYMVKAKVPISSDDAVARAFTQLMSRVEIHLQSTFGRPL